MQCFSRTFLAASISAALLVPTAQAETTATDSVQEMPSTDQCLIDSSVNSNANQEPIVVTADSLEAINGDKASYSGDVKITQGQKVISADKITLHQQDNIAIAEGNVHFTDGQFEANSTRVTSDLASNEFELENTQYNFVCQQGRGDAVYISKTGKAVYQLQDGSITSCPDGDNSWRMVASEIKVDQNEESATFYHPRFEVLDVPIFYAPYITVPIGNTRKTGFLFPSIAYGSSDGFEFEMPFYWNIAPDYDATITTLYMQERGTKFDADFRYLTDGFGEGEIKTEYLGSDRKYTDPGERWAFQYKHDGIINSNWRVMADYSQVSDNDYFRDLDSDIGKREDGQLMQEGAVFYRSQFWDMSLQVRDFQVLVDDSSPYRLLPQVGFNYYTPLWGNYVNFDLKSQVSRFDTNDKAKPSATRAHIEPGITIPLSNTWASWTTEARVLATYYQQDLDSITQDTNNLKNSLDERVSRVIPEFRTHAGIYLERETQIFDGYVQSLEPQVQYLYVPDEDQTNIYNYDTTLLQTDYYGLFRSRKYSSVDKVAPANQISYGASTRFFDESYKERLNISFGQIYYIDKTTKIASNEESSSNYSSWAIETDFNYDDFLFYHGGMQYDIDLGSMQLANSTFEYQFKKGFIQTNYRYVTKEYIEDTIEFTDLNKVTKDGISQAGILGAYNIDSKWTISGQYYHDLTEDVELEWLANLRYRSDCWYIAFTYSNQIRGWNKAVIGSEGSKPDYENNIGINFGIEGFATNSSARTELRDIDTSDNAITYGRPFYLNN
ncbi:LPS assembly protein LptD [Vibrio cortegadensis]|uniref:LPS-assembly protein LptD n=1 Tax=Vibrio cortegadensis TaxID=1328770 RepID=A0ABV4M5U1_9VIBR